MERAHIEGLNAYQLATVMNRIQDYAADQIENGAMCRGPQRKDVVDRSRPSRHMNPERPR